MTNREYFTDFEEMESGHMENTGTGRNVRTSNWTLEDFVPVFNELGLLQDGPEYVSTRTVQTGRVIVNGTERVQSQEIRMSFRYDKDFTAELDGSQLAGVWATITVGDQLLLSELIYCSPEDIRVYYALYIQGR